jgi:hypothetical protein
LAAPRYAAGKHALALPKLVNIGRYDWSDEETDDPLYADDRNFYKVEKWTRDGMKVDRMLYAGNDLDKARELFASAVKHRPRIRLTIRQRTRVLQQWPTAEAALNKKPQPRGRGQVPLASCTPGSAGAHGYISR